MSVEVTADICVGCNNIGDEGFCMVDGTDVTLESKKECGYYDCS